MPKVRELFQEAVRAHRGGNYSRVTQLCDQILEVTGDQAEVLNLKAVALAEAGQMIRASDSIQAALKVTDSDLGSEVRAMLLIHAARIFAALDLFEEAFSLVNEAAVLRPADSGIKYQRARLAYLLGNVPLANEFVEDCLEHYPAFMEARMLQAQIAMETGHLDDAENCYEAIVRAEPRYARGWAGLAEIRRSRLDDDSIIAGLKAVHEAGTDRESARGDWATATFALADAHVRAGEHGTAFQLYSEANSHLFRHNPWDVEAWQSGVARKLEQSLQPAQAEGEANGPQPLFIVGMPRCGSSLLERMLGAHPRVSTSGERQAMTHIERHAGTDIAGLTQEMATEMREIYRKGMRAGEEDEWDCDKANRNFERLELIGRLFPHSKVIWIIRNPLDTIVSCYFQDFQRGLAFTHSLEHLTAMYIGHWRLMNKWQAFAGDSILPVQYESLVNDSKTVIRFICDFLRLEFDPEMLQPQSQHKPVRTASSLQVQEPINTRSVQRWRNYGDQLKDVIDKLHAEHIIDDEGNALLPAGVL